MLADSDNRYSGPLLDGVGEPMGQKTATSVPASRSQTAYMRVIKPTSDSVAAVVLLVMTMPVLVAISIAIRCSMGPGVIFRQERVGRRGRIFTMYKFRTMIPDRRQTVTGQWDGPERRVLHKREDDPRITKLGKHLRRLHIDELPQLVNVLKGDMSLVGPRPELKTIVAAHYLPWQLERHEVKPGITGPWQIDAQSSLIYQNVLPDLQYVKSVSLTADAVILFRTIRFVLALVAQDIKRALHVSRPDDATSR